MNIIFFGGGAGADPTGHQPVGRPLFGVDNLLGKRDPAGKDPKIGEGWVGRVLLPGRRLAAAIPSYLLTGWGMK